MLCLLAVDSLLLRCLSLSTFAFLSLLWLSTSVMERVLFFKRRNALAYNSFIVEWSVLSSKQTQAPQIAIVNKIIARSIENVRNAPRWGHTSSSDLRSAHTHVQMQWPAQNGIVRACLPRCASLQPQDAK